MIEGKRIKETFSYNDIQRVRKKEQAGMIMARKRREEAKR